MYGLACPGHESLRAVSSAPHANVPTMRQLTPDDLARWRRTGDQLDAATARRLMDEVETLWAELARQRVDIATKAAAALEKRPEAVATYNSGGCPKCRDAEARAFLAKLKRIADETP